MKNNGFTLIELVITIIIIGVISAVAIPKFINIDDEAKESSADGMAAAFKSGVSLARSQHLIENEDGFIVLDNGIVSFMRDRELFDFPQVRNSKTCAKLWNTLISGERASDNEGEYIHAVYFEDTCEFSIEEQIFTYNRLTGEVFRG